MKKSTILKIVCATYNYKWPTELTSGVMFYDGHKITIDEFKKVAKIFKI